MKESSEKVPLASLWIHRIYFIYSKIFGKSTSPIKEFIAKCFWVIPYLIERVYMKILVKSLHKQERYICR